MACHPERGLKYQIIEYTGTGMELKIIVCIKSVVLKAQVHCELGLVFPEHASHGVDMRWRCGGDDLHRQRIALITIDRGHTQSTNFTGFCR